MLHVSRGKITGLEHLSVCVACSISLFGIGRFPGNLPLLQSRSHTAGDPWLPTQQCPHKPCLHAHTPHIQRSLGPSRLARGSREQRRHRLPMACTFLLRKMPSSWVNSVKQVPDPTLGQSLQNTRETGRTGLHLPRSPLQGRGHLMDLRKRNSFDFSERIQNDPTNCNPQTYKAN